MPAATVTATLLQRRTRTAPTTPIPRHFRGALSRVARPRNKSPCLGRGFFLRGEDLERTGHEVARLCVDAARRADLGRRWQILPARVRAPHARFGFGGGGFFLRGEDLERTGHEVARRCGDAARRVDLFRRWQILPARVRAPHARFVFGSEAFLLWPVRALGSERREQVRAAVVASSRIAVRARQIDSTRRPETILPCGGNGSRLLLGPFLRLPVELIRQQATMTTMRVEARAEEPRLTAVRRAQDWPRAVAPQELQRAEP